MFLILTIKINIMEKIHSVRFYRSGINGDTHYIITVDKRMVLTTLPPKPEDRLRKKEFEHLSEVAEFLKKKHPEIASELASHIKKCFPKSEILDLFFDLCDSSDAMKIKEVMQLVYSK